MEIEVQQIKPWRLFHCKFDTQHDLCMTFVRLQEFYESPNSKFRGKYFTFEEYVDWYCQKQGGGNFTYCTDWSGFNVPGDTVNDFFDRVLREDDLRPREEVLLKKLDHLLCLWEPDLEPYYIIGTTKDSKLDTMRHEVAHGMFYLNKPYRRAVIEAIKKRKLAGLRKRLLEMGYCGEVIIDECHAYILTGLEEKMKETREIVDLRKRLKEIEKKYIGECYGNYERNMDV